MERILGIGATRDIAQMGAGSLIIADVNRDKVKIASEGPTVSAMPQVALQMGAMSREAKILEATQMKNRSRLVNDGLRSSIGAGQSMPF